MQILYKIITETEIHAKRKIASCKDKFVIKREKGIYRRHEFFLIHAQNSESLVFLILCELVAAECFVIMWILSLV